MPRQSVEHNRGVLVSPTKGDINQYEKSVRELVEDRAIETISDVQGPDDVHVRQLLPDHDLNAGEAGTEGATWEQDPDSADLLTTYEIDSRDKAEKKIVAIFALTNTEGEGGNTTQVEFQTGNGAIIERANVEGLMTDPEDTLLFADPLVYGADQNGVIQQNFSAAEADGVILHGVVAEKAGNTLEESNRFYSQR